MGAPLYGGAQARDPVSGARSQDDGHDDRHRGTVGHEGHSFEAVEAVVANPFPPGTDPALIRLPAVARLRSREDTEENHLRYWQAHLWESLLRYRRAYRDPACPDRLRAGYFDVDQAAVRLAERATSGFPLSPIDSVGCHSMLKELRAGALGLEATVAALSDGAAGPAVGDWVPSSEVEPGVNDAGVDALPVAAPSVEAPLTRDLYMRPPPASSSKGFDFKLSLRGVRGMRRNRSLAGETVREVVPEG